MTNNSQNNYNEDYISNDNQNSYEKDKKKHIGYNTPIHDINDILDVMGSKTRREIINLLREEPRFVSEISKELEIGQKAIIAHLRAMEELGILESSYKKIVRGRPRKYYDMPHDITVNIIINKNTFDTDISEEARNLKQLPPGDEWSRLLNVEARIRSGQLEAIEELKGLVRLYSDLRKRAEDVLDEFLR